MGQYDDVVERQRVLLEAEEWAKQPRSVQVHRLTSMWYETEESVKDFENGGVTDTHYNGGHVVRQQNGKVIRTFGEQVTGEDLVNAYVRGGI